MAHRAVVAGLLSLALLLAGAVGFAYLATRPAPPERADQLASAPPRVADCDPPSPGDLINTGLPELHGKASHGELWALVFRPLPIHAGEETKIVWRMTGSGLFRIDARNPEGAAALLTFGPEQHSGSTWQRPGQEWGTGFIFPYPGCWRIHAERDDASGDVDLVVAPAPTSPAAG